MKPQRSHQGARCFCGSTPPPLLTARAAPAVLALLLPAPPAAPQQRWRRALGIGRWEAGRHPAADQTRPTPPAATAAPVPACRASRRQAPGQRCSADWRPARLPGRRSLAGTPGAAGEPRLRLPPARLPLLPPPAAAQSRPRLSLAQGGCCGAQQTAAGVPPPLRCCHHLQSQAELLQQAKCVQNRCKPLRAQQARQ